MTERPRQEEPRFCDLCGLPIEGGPWVLEAPTRRYCFCCDGCLGIFQILHDIDAEAAAAPGPARR